MAFFERFIDDFVFEDDDIEAQMALFAAQEAAIAEVSEVGAGPSHAPDNEVMILHAEVESKPEPQLNGDMNMDLRETTTDYSILTVNEILKLMNALIGEVKSVVFLPSSVIRILLNRFKWDKQQLYDRFFEGEDERAKLFKESGLTDPNTLSVAATKEKRAKLCCGICFSDFPAQQLMSMVCGHEYCHECWDQYLQTKLNQEDVCQGILCPDPDCKILVEDETIVKLITFPENKRRYEHLTTLTFIETNRLMRRCPDGHCYNAVKVNNREFVKIECTCGHSYCFLCGDKWHEPCSCELLVLWNKRCAGQSEEKIDCETANWILGNTKDCPKCKAPIEKNGGCNHMSCRNVSCRYEFCWLCMEDWKVHGYQSSCNRFNGEKNKDREDARARLERYIHFWTRYQNHLASLKKENMLKNDVKEKMEFLQQRCNMSWIEVQFLKDAVESLLLCRQTLMYSYSFAFYLAENNSTYIFVDNQTNLETRTERLSRLLEMDVSEWELDSIKQDIINIARFCKERRLVMVKHVNEGYDADLWKFDRLD